VIKALLQVYPDAACVKIFGSLALHHLVHTGSASPEAVRLLLAVNPGAASSRNSFGNLPLHYLCASPKPHLESVRILMAAFPEGVSSFNADGETPISRALARSTEDVPRATVATISGNSSSSSNLYAIGAAASASAAASLKRGASASSLDRLAAPSSQQHATPGQAPNASGLSAPLQPLSNSDNSAKKSSGGYGAGGEDEKDADEEAALPMLSPELEKALRRERVRLLMFASSPSALSEDQRALLRQLNWEARRSGMLVYHAMTKVDEEEEEGNAAGYGGGGDDDDVVEGICAARTEEEEAEAEAEMKRKHRLGLLRAACCADNWRLVVSFL